MLSVHVALGIAVIVVCVASAVLGFVAYRRRGSGGAFVSHALVLAQTLLIAQAAVGLLLLSDGRRAPERLHYAYGALALGHPWRASGAVLVVRLFSQLVREGRGRYGLAAIAVGGGQGVAMVVERCP